jgi:hypothetical protein
MLWLRRRRRRGRLLRHLSGASARAVYYVITSSNNCQGALLYRYLAQPLSSLQTDILRNLSKGTYNCPASLRYLLSFLTRWFGPGRADKVYPGRALPAPGQARLVGRCRFRPMAERVDGRIVCQPVGGHSPQCATRLGSRPDILRRPRQWRPV